MVDEEVDEVALTLLLVGLGQFVGFAEVLVGICLMS